MDPGKQDALNSTENSIYRTAFKLRSVQTLCQLDLIDSSQVQHVLLRQSSWEARESPLSVKHLSQAIQELFQGVRTQEPGQVHPRASELTLSLLTTIYDSMGTGFLKLATAAAALIALSGDSPLTKYRALFQLYAENRRGGYDSGARMTRRVLRNLLTDLQQIPAVVGESRALGSVESAVRSCFQGVLSPAIKEEKFLSWLQSEPPLLLWLPTCHQLSATEMVTHPVRCGVCRDFPITGLRYRCLKCLDFDICQLCFLSGLHSKSHRTSHPVSEHRVQEMSAKENTKLLLRAVRNNLVQVGCRRKEAARRQWLRDPVNPKDTRDHAQASSKAPPTYVGPVDPGETASTQARKRVRQMTPRAPPTCDSSPCPQTIAGLRSELGRTRECINTLQKERRLLKKQLNRHKDKLRAIYASQEEKSCRFEIKIHELTASQHSLWTRLQQMGQNLQAMLQPLHSSSSRQNMVSKGDHEMGERFWKEGDSSRIKNAIEDGSEWEPLPNPIVADRSQQSQTKVKDALPKSESPQAILQPSSMQSTRAQSQTQEITREIFSSSSSSQEGPLQDTLQINSAEINSPTLVPMERREAVNIQEEKDELEEEELKELLSKLMDTFTLEMPSDPQSSVTTDLYCGAERVGRAFSALVDQITLANLK